VVVVITAAANYQIDFYGLFHPERHAPALLYSNERTGKYLLAMQYVPRNFDGVLVGSSVSNNWPVTAVSHLHVYNASLSGGNATEELLLVENILRTAPPKFAIICIHPYLTATHGRKSAHMVPSDYWGGLGSLTLLREYIGELVTRHRSAAPLVDANGVNDLSELRDPRILAMRERANVGGAFRPLEVDAAGVGDFETILSDLRQKGVRLVGFIPPTYAPELQAHDYRQYFATIRALFHEDEPVFDFNTPEYRGYTENAGTFLGGAHLSPAAAAYFSLELSRRVGEHLTRTADANGASSTPSAARSQHVR
jgi:hypothetical protein